ncbi:head decoration protein [Pseudochrobactrum sp. MP213Fo]|uniref:head decoration protein n=1 Tax=Pseudochrobactrum sp. MP213Fo TaxID=3022250 RepID=UPI003BA16042
MRTEHYMPGDLLVGDYPVAVRAVTIAGAQGVLKRGTVLGEAAGKYLLSASASSDGSEVPSLVLAIDVDTTAGDVVKDAYASGGFDAAKLIYGTGHTAASVESAFRKASAPLYLNALA